MSHITHFAVYDGKFDKEISNIAPKVSSLNGGYLMLVALSNRTTRLIATVSPYVRLANLERQTAPFGAFIDRVVICRPIYGYLIYRKKLADALKSLEQKPGEFGSLDTVLEVSGPILSQLFPAEPK